MNDAVISLTLTYMMLGLLLLSLNLNSAWSWPVKAVAIGTALPLFVVTFVALQAAMGWPSGGSLPLDFQLHAAVVEEPNARQEKEGAIYLWLTPSNEAVEELDLSETDSLPRAFALPYSRDLHRQVETMSEALNNGKMVAGRHHPGTSWERRFGQQNGAIDLFAPPPPPLPSKDG